MTNNSGTKRSGSKSNTPASKRANTGTPAGDPVPVRITTRVDPEKSPLDPNNYRVITLSNGLTIVLISRPSLQLGPARNHDGSSNRSNLNAPRASFASVIQSVSRDFHKLHPPCQFRPYPSFHCKDAGESSTDWIIKDTSSVIQRSCRRPPDVTSVAMTVNVGGVNDPVDCQGLAHFTEHMVHYGTNKFPQVDAVNVILANFGFYNAVTREHTTIYYNQVPDIIVDQNLDLFADMLLAPTFELSVLNREVNAVDNEFSLRLPSWRKPLLQTHVGIEGNEHPLTRFLCGDLTTLDKARNTRFMKENHSRNYVASAMTLSINSSKSLDELETLTLRHFSGFTPGDRKTLNKTTGENQIPVFRRNKYIYLEGLRDLAQLTLLWRLPASMGEINGEDRVMPMIVRMLNDTSPTSLGYFLMEQELIWKMYTLENTNRYASFVELNFLMMPKGVKSVEKIVKSTLDYVKHLQVSSREPEMKRLFDEMRVHYLRKYHYGSQLSDLETTKDLATRLQYIENTDKLLTCESWQDSTFKFESIQHAMGQLNEANLILVETLSKGTDLNGLGKVNIAPYTGARYVEADWPRSQRPNSRGSGDANVNVTEDTTEPKFGFVSANSYLHRDVRRLRNPADGVDATRYLRQPPNFGDIPTLHLPWQSKHDPVHGEAFIPKITGFHLGHSETSLNPFFSTIQLQFVAPLITNINSFSRALSILWSNVLQYKALPFLSDYITAGFYGQITFQSEYGMVINVSGFPEHINRVMEALVELMFTAPITSTIFSLAKVQAATYCEDLLSDPDLISDVLFNCTTFANHEMSMIDNLGVLNTLTLRNMECFVEAFKRSASCRVLLMGNLPVSNFETLALFLDRMPFAPQMNNDPALYSQKFWAVEPQFYTPGETCVRVKNKQSDMYTTTVTNLYMIGPLTSNQTKADYFSAAMYFMNCEAFMNLRNRKQLGYAVSVNKIDHEKMAVPLMMFSVSITATARKFTACELDQKIDQFLAEYGDYLVGMREDIFKTMLQLTCTPDTVTPVAVGEWFKKKFNNNFGVHDIKWKCLRANVKKQSIQVLTENADAKTKSCTCDICATVNEERDWVAGANYNSNLMFARGRGHTRGYFVTSPKF